MEFDDKSLVRLIDLCNRDKNIGGACGRTSPKGHCNTPVVWYQKFEYAKDFWMIKSSQNVIGCVMCCPGCFSLYRATAIQDVMHMYCEPIQSEFDVFVKDHGEDRWLCTLMMLKGWKLEYSSYSHNSTFCPDNFLEFLKQRKRWVLSEMSNLILVFGNIRRLTQNNSTFSLIYIIYILQMFLLVMLSPGTTVVVLTISLDILFGLSCLYTTPFCIGSLILYSVICSTKSIQAQSAVTSAITIFLGGIVLSVSVGYMKFFVVDTIDDLQDGQLQFKQYYLILLLMTAVLYAALIHPKEAWTLIHGLTFLVVFPAMYILLPFYAVSNIVDQRWGTRESDSDSTSCYRHMSDRLFAKEKNINKRQEIPESQQFNGERDLETCDPAKTILLQKEQTFWEDLRVSILGTDVNLGTDQVTLKLRLKILRNRLVGILLLCNIIWACLLSSLYLTISKHDTIFGIITCSVYSFSLLIQLIGLTAHKCDSFFREFVIRTFGKKHPIWIHRKD
uniref:chitin synthase n=1 Tax=Octopus bimaculoides TaxID=37653 RepID=A0A0L8HFA0_OCTBM